MMEANRLEQALVRASDDPSARNDLYRVLLESAVLVLGSPGESDGGDDESEPAGEIRILHSLKPDGSPLIPFFSSTEALENAIAEERSHMEIPARALFEATRGAWLYLNPRSAVGTEFSPDEVEYLLSLETESGAEWTGIAGETEFLLSHPAEYPVAMVEALAAFLSTRENVQAAWVASIDNPNDDDPSHLVIGIEADGDWEEVIREAGTIAADTAPGEEPIDLFRVIREESMLARYFAEKSVPFYERSRDARPES
jgi:hypothetical protein